MEIFKCKFSNSCFKFSPFAFLILFHATAGLTTENHQETPGDWERQLEMLRSVPYLACSQSAIDEGKVGVIFHDAGKSFPGYNFYCTLSTGEAFLISMDGQIVHRWSYPQNERERGTDHGILLENGDVIILKEFRELVRLDWNSKLLWRRSLPAHHDVAPAPDGSFYVILRYVEPYRGFKVIFPGIAHLTPEGECLDRWSAFEHLDEIKDALDTRTFFDTIVDNFHAGQGPQRRASKIRPSMPRVDLKYYEYFHANTISIIPAGLSKKMDSPFDCGNLLVCFRNVNQIVLLEKDTYRILWAWGEGELEWPHHPTILENGHILIFDNGIRRGYSRVVELDPIAEVIVWEYRSDPPEDFYSHTRGSAQRLPNGNTLICESDRGRVFEVTREGETVWMWQNPDLMEPLWRSLDFSKDGHGGRRHSEAVYRMVRLPEKMVESLLGRWWWWE